MNQPASSYSITSSNATCCGNIYLSTSTGKERDEETGYGYFGARYMDHELMTMWLSVDPMADKYPGISPYAYCAWKPVKLVDPDGREIDSASVTQDIWKMVNGNHELANVMNALAVDPDFTYRFVYGTPIRRDDGSDLFGQVITTGELDKDGRPIIQVMYSNPSMRQKVGNLNTGLDLSNTAAYKYIIAEEIYHAYQVSIGEFGFYKVNTDWRAAGLGLDDEIFAKQFAHKVVYGNTNYPEITIKTLQNDGYKNTDALNRYNNKTAIQALFGGYYDRDDFVDPNRLSMHKNTNLYIFKAKQ